MKPAVAWFALGTCNGASLVLLAIYFTARIEARRTAVHAEAAARPTGCPVEDLTTCCEPWWTSLGTTHAPKCERPRKDSA